MARTKQHGWWIYLVIIIMIIIVFVYYQPEPKEPVQLEDYEEEVSSYNNNSISQLNLKYKYADNLYPYFSEVRCSGLYFF